MNSNKVKNIILNNNFINFLSNLGNFPDMNKPSLFNFTDQIFDTTGKFNSLIYQKIINKYSEKNIVDLRSCDDKSQNYQKTLQALENKSDLILNGLVKGKIYKELMEFNVAIIIKKSLIYDLYSDQDIIIDLKDDIDSSEYHIISHIKCQHLGLLVDGLEIDSKLKIEKYFNVIYQKLLSQMIGGNLKIGFILGKSYRCKKFKEKKYALEHLGIVHKNVDEIDIELKEAFAVNSELEEELKLEGFNRTKIFFDDLLGKYYWYLSNRNQNGYDKPFFEKEDIQIPEYIINDLHKFNLLPNMNIDSIFDHNFSDFKRDFAEHIEEITIVPHCGIDERDFAFEQNIKKYTQIKDVIKDLGMRNGLKRTIEVQGYFNEPKYDISAKNLDILNKNQLSIYFDIEIVNSIITEDFTLYPKSSPPIITVIGLAVAFLDEIQDIKHFVVDNLDQESEAKCFKSFIKYVKKNIIKEYPDIDYNFYHYSSAEHTFINKMFEKNPYIKKKDKEFYDKNIKESSIDLLQIIKEDNICPKNSFGKGLKPIANGFYNVGKIPEKWENSDIDGENSMVYTMKAYQDSQGKNHPFMTEVIKYNKIDCLAMFFIVFYWKYNECYFLDY